MTGALVLLTGSALVIGLAMVAGLRVLGRKDTPIVDAIDDLLPQTQCGQCGYPGCRPYADAIGGGEAEINQCPPGGETVIRELAQLLGTEPRPLDETHGVDKPREIALIDETLCIGCKKCILACPVDAILGAPKLMHTVIASECTGCDLCAPVCPVDCIEMVPAVTGIRAWQLTRPAREPVARLA